MLGQFVGARKPSPSSIITPGAPRDIMSFLGLVSGCIPWLAGTAAMLESRAESQKVDRGAWGGVAGLIPGL